MAKLPEGRSAIIDRRKITDYLLNEAHEEGGPKARFFTSFGWSLDEPDRLIASLEEQVEKHDFDCAYQTPFGEKFEITGTIQAPDGRDVVIKTVWIILNGEAVPRFVTALPA